MWVIAAHSAASLQNVGSAVRMCGIVIGAMRMSAPLPADRAAERHQDAPCFIPATNCPTVLPMPKISREAKVSASRSGMSVPYSTRCSRVQNASWLSSDGSPTERFPAWGFGRYSRISPCRWRRRPGSRPSVVFPRASPMASPSIMPRTRSQWTWPKEQGADCSKSAPRVRLSCSSATRSRSRDRLSRVDAGTVGSGCLLVTPFEFLEGACWKMASGAPIRGARRHQPCADRGDGRGPLRVARRRRRLDPTDRLVPLVAGFGLADGEDRPFRMARRQRSPSAVGDEVERFEHELSDQDPAPGRSHDGLGPRGEVSDLYRDVGHGSLFAAFVRVDDGSRSPVPDSDAPGPPGPRRFRRRPRFRRAGRSCRGGSPAPFTCSIR